MGVIVVLLGLEEMIMLVVELGIVVELMLLWWWRRR